MAKPNHAQQLWSSGLHMRRVDNATIETPISRREKTREQVQAEIDAYLAGGGVIKHVPPGASGLNNGAPPTRHIVINAERQAAKDTG